MKVTQTMHDFYIARLVKHLIVTKEQLTYCSDHWNKGKFFFLCRKGFWIFGNVSFFGSLVCSSWIPGWIFLTFYSYLTFSLSFLCLQTPNCLILNLLVWILFLFFFFTDKSPQLNEFINQIRSSPELALIYESIQKDSSSHGGDSIMDTSWEQGSVAPTIQRAEIVPRW